MKSLISFFWGMGVGGMGAWGRVEMLDITYMVKSKGTQMTQIFIGGENRW